MMPSIRPCVSAMRPLLASVSILCLANNVLAQTPTPNPPPSASGGTKTQERADDCVTRIFTLTEENKDLLEEYTLSIAFEEHVFRLESRLSMFIGTDFNLDPKATADGYKYRPNDPEFERIVQGINWRTGDAVMDGHILRAARFKRRVAMMTAELKRLKDGGSLKDVGNGLDKADAEKLSLRAGGNRDTAIETLEVWIAQYAKSFDGASAYLKTQFRYATRRLKRHVLERDFIVRRYSDMLSRIKANEAEIQKLLYSVACPKLPNIRFASFGATGLAVQQPGVCQATTINALEQLHRRALALDATLERRAGAARSAQQTSSGTSEGDSDSILQCQTADPQPAMLLSLLGGAEQPAFGDAMEYIFVKSSPATQPTTPGDANSGVPVQDTTGKPRKSTFEEALERKKDRQEKEYEHAIEIYKRLLAVLHNVEAAKDLINSLRIDFGLKKANKVDQHLRKWLEEKGIKTTLPQRLSDKNQRPPDSELYTFLRNYVLAMRRISDLERRLGAEIVRAKDKGVPLTKDGKINLNFLHPDDAAELRKYFTGIKKTDLEKYEKRLWSLYDAQDAKILDLGAKARLELEERMKELQGKRQRAARALHKNREEIEATKKIIKSEHDRRTTPKKSVKAPEVGTDGPKSTNEISSALPPQQPVPLQDLGLVKADAKLLARLQVGSGAPQPDGIVKALGPELPVPDATGTPTQIAALSVADFATDAVGGTTGPDGTVLLATALSETSDPVPVEVPGEGILITDTRNSSPTATIGDSTPPPNLEGLNGKKAQALGTVLKDPDESRQTVDHETPATLKDVSPKKTSTVLKPVDAALITPMRVQFVTNLYWLLINGEPNDKANMDFEVIYERLSPLMHVTSDKITKSFERTDYASKTFKKGFRADMYQSANIADIAFAVDAELVAKLVGFNKRDLKAGKPQRIEFQVGVEERLKVSVNPKDKPKEGTSLGIVRFFRAITGTLVIELDKDGHPTYKFEKVKTNPGRVKVEEKATKIDKNGDPVSSPSKPDTVASITLPDPGAAPRRIVVAKNRVAKLSKRAVLGKLAAKKIEICSRPEYGLGPKNNVAVLEVRNATDAEATEIANNIKAAPGVVSVDPSDPCMRIEAKEAETRAPPRGSDPYYAGKALWGQDFDNQWAIKRVGYDATETSVWARAGKDLKPVTVAVIDTGFDWYHPDFDQAQLWRNTREIPGNGIDDDGNGYVDDVIGWNFIDNTNRPWDHQGHGTFVTGVIAAKRGNGTGIAGINPAARIMVLKALDAFGQGHASTVAQAITYAADHGARVINLSLGGPGATNVVRLAVEYAQSRGVLVVMAAGNEGEPLAKHAAGGLKDVITVAASDRADRRAPFSNWGPAISLAAPGVDVLSLRARRTDVLAFIRGVKYEVGAGIVGPERAYVRASGTSFAAPIVTGTASLLMSAKPGLDADAVRRIILNSAHDIETEGIDNYTGYGLLDATAALAADPTFYLESRIAGVTAVKIGGGIALRVTGSADADDFDDATVLLGRGANPRKWQQVNQVLKKPVRQAPLIDLPAKFFAGSKDWTLRLIAKHKNGKTREARFYLKLG